MDWRDGYFRLFLSHVSDEKVFVSEVKDALVVYAIDGFVAHEDIEPARHWVEEIEDAPRTCQAFVAFLHEGFQESDWTDQEVGYAASRQILMIPVRLGLDPYGFLGRF